jgi:hypothetical protein
MGDSSFRYMVMYPAEGAGAPACRSDRVMLTRVKQANPHGVDTIATNPVLPMSMVISMPPLLDEQS